jgi:L-fucose isomerase-like protein
MEKSKITLGLIVGNRGFFPGHLAELGRAEMVQVLHQSGADVVVLDGKLSNYGAIETYEEAMRCAELFRANSDRIDGVVVTLPNFGDERAIADTLRLSRLKVPVLVQATPDTPSKMTIAHRRDSFCGKMSACNNLRQYGIPYSLTTSHTVSPGSAEFKKDLAWFTGVCRGYRGVQNNDEAAQVKLAAIHKYVTTSGVPPAALLKMAKLGAVIDQWMKATHVTISAVQCWTSIEENLGVVPCTVMSMMSNELLPSACEVDICGTLSMYALALASETPSALLDWNNNYGENPDKAVCFHCSNLPKHFFKEVRMDYQQIIAGTVGKDNTFGTCVGQVKAAPMSFARFSTDDENGVIRGYVGEGRFTEDPLETFGGAGVVEIPHMQKLLRYICENGFEHHVAANLATVAGIVHEVATNYMGWETYWHGR